MPQGSNSEDAKQVRAAALAILRARGKLLGTDAAPRRVTLRTGAAGEGQEVAVPSDDSASPRPTPEQLEAAEEAALAGFPERIREAARASIKARLDPPSQPRSSSRSMVQPSLVPTNLPPRPVLDPPPYPAAALDDPVVREEWGAAHEARANAHYMLQPRVLRAYAEARLDFERWNSRQGGRKPSGDLRHPVPRNRLAQIFDEMRALHEGTISRTTSTIEAIESGDVVGVEVVEIDVGRYDTVGVAVLIRQSELDRKQAVRLEKASRTSQEIEAAEAEWGAMIESMLEDLPPDEPEIEIPGLIPLPTDRKPTKEELEADAKAIASFLAYQKVADQIEAKRRKEAATKVRTRTRLAAEQADPEGTAEAKRAIKLAKAADRQRRYRERRKTTGRGSP